MDLTPIVSRPKKGSAGKTGEWRLKKPVIIHEACSKCMNCELYCPEGVVYQVNDTLVVDYEYCKGCGICAEICEQNAIIMEDEA